MAKNSIDGILDFLDRNPKNRLVIDTCGSWDKECFDIGYHLASALMDSDNPSLLVGSVIYKLIHEHKSVDDKIGYVIAFRNIGILFEPELKINLRLLLDSVSKSITLVICSPGLVKNDTFFYLNENTGISIDLKGMSYYTLE